MAPVVLQTLGYIDRLHSCLGLVLTSVDDELVSVETWRGHMKQVQTIKMLRFLFVTGQSVCSLDSRPLEILN